jgi:transcriptional regulator with XRE-family HTH domain
MKNFFKRNSSENISEEAQLREVDERHFLSEQVFQRRDALGWSQQELARQADLTQAQVANVEAGHANPTLRTLSKLAVVFGCAVSDLFANSESQSDGCIADDKAGAEKLRSESSPFHSWDDPRWEEERQAQEFVLLGGLDLPMPPSGQGPFENFLLRHTLIRNQHDVTIGGEDEPNLYLNEYDDALTEL